VLRRFETPMTDLILHHYDFSNFAEKVRLTLGYKGLAWRSVIIPPIAPKPDLIPLTGGYRRTPVLQVGADIYCDTRLIVREIERRFPTPSLFAHAQAATADAIAYWAENRLMRPITLYVSGMNVDHLPEGLQADRSLMRGLPPPDAATMRRAALRNAPLVRAQLPQVEQMLSDGRRWMAGAEPSVADLAVYHPLWFFTARTRLLAHELTPFVRTAEWMERVRAFGHGSPSMLSPRDALDIARAADPEPIAPSSPAPEDPALGSLVRVRADDYGRDAIEGELVHLSLDEIAVRRTESSVGTVVVHFPRLGYDLRPLERRA
jgi:glutathione S-transferase